VNPAAVSQHQRRKRWWFVHLALFLVVNGFFVATWLMIQSQPNVTDLQAREGFYPGWLLIVWGAIVGLHGLYVWARRPMADSLLTGKRGVGRTMRTILFTDIVGSTEMATRIGDRAWREMLDTHDRVSRKMVTAHHGSVVKQTGDGMLAVFTTPYEAIAATLALRDELARRDLAIRAGLHTGEIELRDGDVGGIAVHIASRVMAAAEPSQILASSTVRDLATGSGARFVDPGRHELKGIDGTWELYTLEGAG
jgi:class 3 adenylate cyclase